MRKPCCDKEDTNKGAWSKHEDQKLIDYIGTHGEGSWRTLPQAAGLQRCGKSCRLRWINYLRPDLKRGNFAEDEEDLIVKLHALLGNRWSLIAGRLPGRTDNEVKNYWNSHLRRKLINMGINPDNHRINRSNTPFVTSATSSTSKIQKRSHPEAKCRGEHDLNLDLTLTVPSSSTDIAQAKEATNSNESIIAKELHLNLPHLMDVVVDVTGPSDTFMSSQQDHGFLS